MDQIIIFDKTGIKKKQWIFNDQKTSQSVNIQDLSSGVYILRVRAENKWYSCQLMVF
ncbi:MAG: T9SS type A sorting domain-containing protein [Bacteroidetes bacterium]|nr:T9SS type A sorting domain-containing protein [Bacteroidota bacterium]